jgi:hypothetical protein
MRFRKRQSEKKATKMAQWVKEIRKVLLPFLCFFLAIFPYVHEQSTAEPAAASAPANLGDLKRQITEYKLSGGYDRDVAAVLGKAQQYVVRRAPMVRTPAIVLDIDETSLSNWPEIRANDYGLITNGPCNLPAGPCGTGSWVASAQDEAILPTLALFPGSPSIRSIRFFHHGTQRGRAACD